MVHKKREWYRPVAPVMLECNAKKVTGLNEMHHLSQLMLLDFAIKEEFKNRITSYNVCYTKLLRYSENKGHNKYYMLPLILGLIGLAFQYSKGKEGKLGFWIVLSLFFLTGLAIVLYLNQTPYQRNNFV